MPLISRSSLLRAFVGRTWQNFIGLSYDDTCTTLESVLDSLGWAYTVEERSSSLTDRAILGGGDTTAFVLEDRDITVECVSAAYDPVQRAIFNLVVRAETRSKYEEATTVLRISPVTSETEPDIVVMLDTLMESIKKDPWHITHPRFRLSPVLQYKTRLFWEYWQSDAPRSS